MAAKPPITCHALDTSVGRPASHIPVTLTLLSSPSSATSTPGPVFKGTTNDDGRVVAWEADTGGPDALADAFHAPGDQTWCLVFDTLEYFGKSGVAAFFPEVRVVFVVRDGQKAQHFHVPVLLGPFGYTTYRGS